MGPSLAALDVRTFFRLYGAGGGAFTGLALVLSAVGSGWTTLGLLPLYGVARWRRFAAALTAVVVASASAVFLLKQLFGRARPCSLLPGVHALCAAPTNPSFPSGHACGSFTLAVFVVLVLYGRGGGAIPPLARGALAALLLSFAAGVAWSRVYLGVHFPADVAAGAALGAVSGAIGGWLYLRSPGRPERAIGG